MGLPVDSHAVCFRRSSRRFGRFAALDGLDLTVPRGGVCGLVGNNGAGKTTAIHCLMGMLPLSGGELRVLDLDPQLAGDALRQRVGFFPERDEPYKWMRLETLLRMARRAYPTWDDQLAWGWVERFGLDRRKRFKQMSKGMVAKAKLTVALGHRPELLVLDEPTSGLDPGSRHDLLEAVRERAAEGVSVLVSSHNLDDLSRLVTDVAVMVRGRLRLGCTAAEIRDRFGRLTVPMGVVVPPALEALRVGGSVGDEASSGSVCLLSDRNNTELAAWVSATPGVGLAPVDLVDVFHLATQDAEVVAATVGEGEVTHGPTG